jgi:hypothetical protein
MNLPLRLIGAQLCIAALFVAGKCYAVECRMSLGFWQQDISHIGKRTPVWKDTSPPQGASALLFRHALEVNTDGTRRSYSVEDFWGETRAVNNLCNAMSDSCVGLTRAELRDRRIITQQAKANQWPIEQLKATRIDPQIIPFKDGRPCPEVDGYLVSATALQQPLVKDACDPKVYLDAATVPALVLPEGIQPAPGKPRAPTGFDLADARIGDLVVAISPSTPTPVYGVVGDIGPDNKLGEASVAMNGPLANISRAPINYKDVIDHWVVGDATVLIFSGTRDAKSPYLTNERINHDAAIRFAQWGGGSLSGAMDRLKSCSIAIGK